MRMVPTRIIRQLDGLKYQTYQRINDSFNVSNITKQVYTNCVTMTVCNTIFDDLRRKELR